MTSTDDYDNPWKQAVEHDFQAFLAFFFPEAHDQIDWSVEISFLEQELRSITHDSEQGRKLVVDVLARVRRLDGAETWVYVHIEVQTQYDPDLPKRVFVYHYRLFDRHDAPVASLVVLADTRPNWRPDEYRHTLFGCEVTMRFPVIKLADYAERLDELLADPNPFALVTAAHLLTQRTKGDDLERYQVKRRLIRLLYERGWSKQRVWDLFHVIDWLLQAPRELNERLNHEIKVWEEEEFHVRYISSIERIAMEKGMEQGRAIGETIGEARGEARGELKMMERLLTRRFGPLPESARERLRRASTEQLEAWSDRVLEATELKAVFDG